MEAQTQMATCHTLYVYVYFVGMYSLHVCVLSYFSHVLLFTTLWTVAHQAPLSVGFSREEYWSELLSSSRGSFQPRDRTHVSCLLYWQMGSLPLAPSGKPICILYPHTVSVRHTIQLLLLPKCDIITLLSVMMTIM